ncbi:MAG TPA: GH116 family glycosyl hydrolase [Acidobacteriota bacterium]|nr:hypothetical protein [Acidobacteriota bacterium]HNU01044.1 GH116 family glycosyl hydrolase [Acidobacteriota bacterium]HPB28805.1 GH116 family glycosyl hydrolase [Acidobacteriota bacterium]HQP74530.1 GH116 family glycosyl hydrolase [Acidobacteriota bacterium]
MMPRGIRILAVLAALAASAGGAVHPAADSVAAPPATIAAFALDGGAPRLSRLAQPHQYFDRIGRRAALMGFEDGTFEAWVWPWKVLRQFQLQFLLGSSTQPIAARDIVRRITVTPAATEITYAYESFTVRAVYLVPENEPGALVLLEARTTAPLTIIAGFLPVLQPMWPAGIGGQYSHWDEDARAFVISEGQRRVRFLCGSPAAGEMSAPPAHMFADSPLQFRLDVRPGDPPGRFIPIAIAGGDGLKPEEALALYRRLAADAPRLHADNVAAARRLMDQTIAVETPDPQLNAAMDWGRVALHNLVVDNPALGRGLVAGYGLSGGSARPGFAWFFGGDTCINALALDSLGDFEAVRDGLRLLQRWQRGVDHPIRRPSPDAPPADVGKIPHELTQSAGLVDWWHAYRYGYNHADSTPWYLVAVGDYLRASGDAAFVRESWPSIAAAWRWCQGRDSDGDGLMDIAGAGLGALEFGQYTGIYTDCYTAALYLQASRAMVGLAAAAGDAAVRAEADAALARGQAALEQKFWLEAEGIYAYGITAGGEQVRDLTPWPAAALAFGLAEPARSARMLRRLGGAETATDWGFRTLSARSPLYQPLSYNYGAVMPFVSVLVNTAQFRHGFALPGWAALRGVAAHAFDHGLGVAPEVFSGATNMKVGEAYHNQGFSTTAYVAPLLRGLLGLEPDAPAGRLTFALALPAGWDFVRVDRVPLAGRRVNLSLRRTAAGLVLDADMSGGEPMELVFRPLLPPGTRVMGLAVNGAGATPAVAVTPRGVAAACTVRLAGEARVELALEWPPAVFLLPAESAVGDPDRGPRIIDQAWTGAGLRLELEGQPGRAYALGVTRPERVRGVVGAELREGRLHFTIPGAPDETFVPHVITFAVIPREEKP